MISIASPSHAIASPTILHRKSTVDFNIEPSTSARVFRYWLYAAVSCKCLLVTNDEMRDHLFQLLGNSFFPSWKEKHQVRISVSREDGLSLHMPPPYSIVIQESEDGTWHVPMSVEDDLQTSRQWLCARRSKTH